MQRAKENLECAGGMRVPWRWVRKAAAADAAAGTALVADATADVAADAALRPSAKGEGAAAVPAAVSTRRHALARQALSFLADECNKVNAIEERVRRARAQGRLAGGPG